MTVPKKTGALLVLSGAALILSALLLLLFNGFETRRAGQEAVLAVGNIQSHITVRAQETESCSTEPVETLPAQLPEVMIDGFAYIGYLSIPQLELELPVMSQWDYSRLKTAPCRQFGSSRTDDLVIAAHNYQTHFGALSALETGTKIQFTDMDGICNDYVLTKLETVAPNDVAAVQESGSDLVLYTCTPGGAARVAAFCNRSVEETSPP